MIRRTTFICFLTALLFLAGAGLARAQSPLTLGDYEGRVEQAVDLVSRAASQPGDARQPLLDQAAALIQEVHSVQLDSGAPVTVDNSALAAAIRSSPNSLDASLARLRALRASLAALPSSNSSVDRARARDLLSRPPFQDSQDPFWVEIERRIADFLNGLLDRAGQGIYDWRDVVTVVGILIVAGVIVFLIWNFRKNAAAETRLPGAESAGVAQTSGGALSRAQQFANDGDYRSAIRELYLATLLLLDERGRLRFDSALTNREYLQAASREPALAAALQPVVDSFDRVWYGFEKVTPDEFHEYQAQVDGVRRQVVMSQDAPIA